MPFSASDPLAEEKASTYRTLPGAGAAEHYISHALGGGEGGEGGGGDQTINLDVNDSDTAVAVTQARTHVSLFFIAVSRGRACVAGVAVFGL